MNNEIPKALNTIYLSEFWVRFAIFFGIFCLFVCPIIRADVLFYDDICRISEGYFFNQDRRYLASFAAFLLSGGRFFADNYPFNLFVALGFVSAALSKLSLVWKFNRLSSLLVFSPIICSPFLLACLSYRFDSLTMLLALVCAITPFLISKSSLKWLWAEISILAILFFYQPFFNLFLTLIGLFSCLVFLEQGRRASIQYYLKYLISAFVALVLYEVIVWLFEITRLFSAWEWAKEAGSTQFNIYLALKAYFSHVADVMSLIMRGNALEYCILAGTLLGVILLFVRMIFSHEAKKIDWQNALWGLFLIGFVLFSAIGLLCFLEKYEKSFRFLVGLNGIIVCALFGFVGKNASFFGWRAISSFLALSVSFSALNLSFLLGNALKAQDTFTDKAVDQVASALAQFSRRNLVSVRFFGGEGYSPRSKVIYQVHPILEEASLFYGLSDWTDPFKGRLLEKIAANKFIKHYNKSSPSQSSAVGDEIRSACKYDEIMYQPFFNAYRLGDKVVIDFEKKCHS